MNMKVTRIIKKILDNRGITYEDLVPPKEIPLYNFKNMSEGREQYIRNIISNKKIGILYDVDVDGVYSGKIMTQEIRELGCKVVYTMNYGKEHGMNKGIVRWVKKQEVEYLIVVDAGTGDKEYYRELVKNGVEVLVLDHHPASEEDLELEEGIVIVSNNYEGSPNKELSGAGVVYNFIRYVNEEIGRETTSRYTTWVGLTVLSDSCSMMDSANRYFVKQLYDNYMEDGLLREFTNYGSLENMFNFKVIPLINACIRMEEYMLVINLINVKCSKKAKELIELAEKVREDQRELVNKVYSEVKIIEGNGAVLGKVESNGKVKNVTGLVANKMKEEYNKSAILVRREGEVYKGSFRGRDNFTKETLEKLSIDTQGHEKASGVSFRVEEYESKAKELLEYRVEEIVEKKYELVLQEKEVLNNTRDILRIALLNEYSGKDFEKINIKIKGIERVPMIERREKVNRYKFIGYEVLDFEGRREEFSEVVVYPVVRGSSYVLVRQE